MQDSLPSGKSAETSSSVIRNVIVIRSEKLQKVKQDFKWIRQRAVVIIRADETGEGKENPVYNFTAIAFQYGYFELAHLLLYRAEQNVSE